MVTYTYFFLFCWCCCCLFLFSFLTSFVGLSHSELFETLKKTVFSRVLHLRYVREPSTLLLALAFIGLELRKKKITSFKAVSFKLPETFEDYAQSSDKTKASELLPKSMKHSNFLQILFELLSHLKYNCHLHF